MKLLGRTEGETQLHSNGATFCGIDVYPPEIYEDPIDDTRISYTGVIIPQPEHFEGLAQWKETDNLNHRIQILRSILSLAGREESRAVLCFTVHTTKANGWLLGKRLLLDFAAKTPETESYTTNKGRRYRVLGKSFNEKHAITLFTYAYALAVMFQHVAREVTKSSALTSLQKPILQFLIDNVSGDPAPGMGTQWYLDLMLFIIENSELHSITKGALKRSCFSRLGISIPVSNKILDREEIHGHNKIPLMIAADWFTRVCGQYLEIDSDMNDLSQDDQLIVQIIDTLRENKCLIRQALPPVPPEQEWK